MHPTGFEPVTTSLSAMRSNLAELRMRSSFPSIVFAVFGFFAEQCFFELGFEPPPCMCVDYLFYEFAVFVFVHTKPPFFLSQVAV